MPDPEKLAAVREALPAVGAGIYLDTATAGPIPAEAAAAMAEIAGWELRTGRAVRDRRADVEGRLDEARATVAAALTVDLEAVTLAQGIEDALARAIRAIDWRAGDRLAWLADPGIAALPNLVPPGVESAACADADALAAAIDLPRTRLAAVPLIAAGSGRRLPVASLAASARAAGSRLLIDASLAAGAVPLDLTDTAPDVVVSRADAWLLGPQGLSVVVAAAGVRDRVHEPAPETFHLPSVVGFGRACGWLSMYVGLSWAVARTEALTSRAIADLAAIDGVRVHTPAPAVARGAVVAFSIDGWPAERALDELGARIFLIASEAVDLDAVRIGPGCWNTDAEIDRLVEAVRLLAAHTPDSLPPRRLSILGQDR
jgi:selenocysteine lyase/cysteine desulfurase